MMSVITDICNGRNSGMTQSPEQEERPVPRSTSTGKFTFTYNMGHLGHTNTNAT